MRFISLATLGLVTALSTSALAQSSDATAPTAIPPATSTPDTVTDAAIRDFEKLVTGSFTTTSVPEQRFSAAAVAINGLDNAILFEITPTAAPTEPSRLGIMHVYRRQGQLRLRIFDFAGPRTLKDALVGVWAAPAAYWEHELSSLVPRVDMPLRIDSGIVRAQTTEPVPTIRNGAIDMTCVLRASADVFEIAERGFDAEGALVWGPPLSATPTVEHAGVFHRLNTPTTTARRTDDGLTIITLTPSSDPNQLAEGGEVSVQYTGYLTDGTPFDSSRNPGREALKIRVPDTNLIQGWNKGLIGIAKGERRRLIIPPILGYGDKPAGRGKIPANSTLIFDVECLAVRNAASATPSPATPAPTPSP